MSVVCVDPGRAGRDDTAGTQRVRQILANRSAPGIPMRMGLAVSSRTTSTEATTTLDNVTGRW